MINLNDILQQAQGGQALDNLGARFGLPPDQVRSAVEALLPALQMGLQNRVASGGLGSPVGGGAAPSSIDPSAPADEQHGHSILGQIFGGAGTIASIARQAAAQSGLPASVIQAMLPVIASLIMNEIAGRAGGGAFGGILSNVLGSILGGASAPAPPQGGASSGGLGGAIGDILGGFLGGGSHPVPQHQASPQVPTPTAPLQDEPATPSSGDATLDEISNMFTAGTPPAPEHEAAIANIVRR